MLKDKFLLIVIGGVVLVAGLAIVLNFSGEPTSGETSNNAGVPCLIASMPLQQHIHPHLTIEVDGKDEALPVNIGLGACEKAIHTHDDTGEIHVEAQDTREYTLGDIFNAWGRSINRDGYNLKMTVDGVEVTDHGFILKDKQQIILNYTRIQ
ncbi:MAG: hypothetical protein HYR95_00945 [Candidatus Colwellbacteria bacterium]|nr:hypothetical protein [Candidatus Colwellbacteria bacterium]